METEIIIGAVGLVTTVVSGYVSFLLTKKKYNAEVDNSIIEGMQHSLDFYKTLSDDNRTRLDEIMERSTRIEHENQVLKEENKALKEKQNELEKVVESLTAKVEELLSRDSAINNEVRDLEAKVEGKRKKRNEKDR